MVTTRQVAVELNPKISPQGKAAMDSLSGRFSKLETKAKKAFQIGKYIAAGAAVGGIVIIKKAISAASDYQEVLGKFKVVYGANSEAVKKWSESYAKSVGVSKRASMEFLASSQDLFVPLGFAAEKAEEMSKQVLKLGVDLGSFNNKKPADVIRDIQAALTGSGEVMKKYGVLLSEKIIKEEMSNNIEIKSLKITEDKKKAMARLAIIMRGTTAAQGDAIRTAGSWANLLKRLGATVENLSVSLGNKLLPVLTPLLAKFEKFVADNGPDIAETFGKIVESVASVTLAIGDWIKNNPGWTKVIAVLIGAKATGLTGIAWSLGSIAKMAPAAIKAISSVFAAKTAAVAAEAAATTAATTATTTGGMVGGTLLAGANVAAPVVVGAAVAGTTAYLGYNIGKNAAIALGARRDTNLSYAENQTAMNKGEQEFYDQLKSRGKMSAQEIAGAMRETADVAQKVLKNETVKNLQKQNEETLARSI